MRSLITGLCSVAWIYSGCGDVTASSNGSPDAAAVPDSPLDSRATSRDASRDAPRDTSALPDVVAPCAFTSTTTLAGAHIVIDSQPCVFTLAQAAAGIQITYEVVIDHDIEDVVSVPQDYGFCSEPGPSGLTVFERLSGGSQSYCLCDQGLCTPQTTGLMTLPAGQYATAFKWTGLNWNGFSDTNEPEGAPFPAGTYALDISARGYVGGDPDAGGTRFDVKAGGTITLVP